MQPTMPIYLQPYPSLSSPMTGFLSARQNFSPKPSVFERLQEDTEKRMRSRMETFSAPRKFQMRASTPQQYPLTSKIIQRTQSRLSRQSSEVDLTFHPIINKKSQEIFNTRYLQKAKIHKTRQMLYTDEEYSNPAEIEEVPFTVKKEKKVPQSEANLLIQQQIFNEGGSVTDRKYVPMFTKPFDLGKILGKQGKKEKKEKKEVKDTGKEKMVRPLLRPISESSLRNEDTLMYQKIVQDRIEKLKEMKAAGKNRK